MSTKVFPLPESEINAFAAKVETPFHIYDEAAIENNVRRIQRAFAWNEGFINYFAVKALPNVNIVRMLGSLGFGADCSSLAELIIAEQAGITGERIMFTSNDTPDEEFRKAYELGAVLNLDDITHIEAVERAVGSFPETVSFRYNPGAERTGNAIIGNPVESKYGVTRSQIFDCYRIAKEKGAKRLILDLRGNGGGLLNEAVDILSIFLPEGTLVVSQKGRKNVGADLEYRTRNEPVDTLIPLMVLVNSGSASSSEIVTGAIQDLDRGYVAGTRTYGKGLVQAIRPVGYNGTMKMTIAKYYTPSGRCVQAIDYSHRNSDGSVGYVPDSLKKAFKTRLGRTVYDGGGITPDSVITSDPYSRIAISLVMNDIINDYAIKFYKENDSIPSVEDFSLTDEQYGDFVKYAVSRNFDSRSGAQVLMEDLLKSAEQEELDDYIRAEAEALKNKLSISKEKMLELKRSEIQPLVEEEIANKYHFTAGRVEAIIKNDSQLKKAVELFAGI